MTWQTAFRQYHGLTMAAAETYETPVEFGQTPRNIPQDVHLKYEQFGLTAQATRFPRPGRHLVAKTKQHPMRLNIKLKRGNKIVAGCKKSFTCCWPNSLDAASCNVTALQPQQLLTPIQGC
jgi:hypothetical protein